MAARLLDTVRFLAGASSYHGVFPHFLDGETGLTKPFTRKDDGGDIVETAFLMMGLLCARQYLDGDAPVEAELRLRIQWLWDDVEWDWHAPEGDVLLWHWSPNHGWAMRHEIRGWNECLLAYVLAAGSARHPIGEEVYHQGWATGPAFRNGRSFFDIELPLGPDHGGPLFFSHYSFMGLDPRGLFDRYADYWQQNVAHTAINRAYCLANPKGFCGLRPRLLGAHRERQPGRLRGPRTGRGSRRHQPDRRPLGLALRARRGHAGASPPLREATRSALDLPRLRRRLQRHAGLDGRLAPRDRPGADRGDDREPPKRASLAALHELPRGPDGPAPARLHKPAPDI